MSRKTWATLGILSLALMGGETTAFAQCCIPPGLYVGLFGGSGSVTSTRAYQSGTAFFLTPLAVDARANVNSNSTGFGGAQLGYAWRNPCWLLTPAIEFEGYYLGTTLHGTLDAPHTALDEHAFKDSFPINSGVYLINTVFAFNTCWPCLHPYLGGGIGAATLNVSGADSTQVRPPEAGVNHFNTKTTAHDNVFAAQFKAGLSYTLSRYVDVFAEYRYLYLGSSQFTFGSTSYPALGHVPTSPWLVNINSLNYNLGAVGIRFSA